LTIDEWEDTSSIVDHQSSIVDSMPTFRYFPPGSEEQKNFALQFLGTLLALALAAFLFYAASDVLLKAVLAGAGAGLLWLLGRAAWQLEKKAQRAQQAQIEIDEDGVLLTDARGHTQRVLWREITVLEVRGGRLHVAWSDGELTVGAREVENGMALVREITRRYQRRDDGGQTTPSNFIPLEPK
jgi:hypothetical protein